MTPTEQQAMIDRLNARFDDAMRQIEPSLDNPDEAYGPAQFEIIDRREPNPLIDNADPSLLRPEEQTLTLPDGTVVTASQIEEFLERYEGPLSPWEFQQAAVVDGVEINAESAMSYLANVEAENEAEEELRRARAEAEWAESQAASRPGTRSVLTSD